MLQRAFVLLQYLLPRHRLTAAVHRIARVRLAFVKNTLIRMFVRIYDVDVAEIDREIPRDFRDLNDFFTRELAAGARPIDERSDSFVSPVDGTVSAAGRLVDDAMLQAKGIDYSLDELFAIDLEEARGFANGCFATIYLAPYNYHRVHMPIDGELTAAHYVPGDLWSVNDATVARISGLFHKNERLNLHFRTPHGPAAVVFVGALNVGSITTPWTGEVRPRKRGVAEVLDLGRASREVRRGDLLGWFNMGSTVIVLMPDGAVRWRDGLNAGSTVRMGERIGELAHCDA